MVEALFGLPSTSTVQAPPDAVVTDRFRPGQIELIAQDFQQRGARLGLDLPLLTIDVQRDGLLAAHHLRALVLRRRQALSRQRRHGCRRTGTAQEVAATDPRSGSPFVFRIRHKITPMLSRESQSDEPRGRRAGRMNRVRPEKVRAIIGFVAQDTTDLRGEHRVPVEQFPTSSDLRGVRAVPQVPGSTRTV